MDRDFIRRQTLVWLEIHEVSLRNDNNMRELIHRHRGKTKGRERLAELLTNHLANNWEQMHPKCPHGVELGDECFACEE